MANVLVACEESQRVTIFLREMGIEAYSCDLQPCSGGHPEWHLQQDVRQLLHEPWDMMFAFPPCTHLAIAGNRHRASKITDGRQQEAIDFFMLFANNDCPHIAIENPVGIMSTVYRKPDQVIDPYEFGESVRKRTCLWLKNLPHLVPTDKVYKGTRVRYPDGTYDSTYNLRMANIPIAERSKERSKTFIGIAKAMATQWGGILDAT